MQVCIYAFHHIKHSQEYKFIYPAEFSKVGSITYKFELPESLEYMNIKGIAYAYLPNNYVKIYASLDESNYKELGKFEGASNTDYTREFSYNLTNIMKESNTAYIKIEMYTNKGSDSLWRSRLEKLDIQILGKTSKATISTKISRDGSWTYSDDYSTEKYMSDSYNIQDITRHDQYNILHPSEYNTIGSITYAFESPKPIKSMIIEPTIWVSVHNNYLKVYASRNGIDYSLLQTFDENTGSATPSIDATNVIKGSKTAYIKIEMYVDKNSVTIWDARIENLKVYGQVE